MPTEDRHKGIYMPVRLAPETREIIDRIAEAEGKSRSEVVRSLIDKGLAAGGYLPGLRELDEVVRETMISVLQPSVTRLAAISAKAAHIGAAAFFMAMYAARLSAPSAQRDELDAVASKARRLGVEYLKLSKDRDLDEWLDAALRKMQRDGAADG